MNQEQLEAVAKRQGLVRWQPSGKIEMLRMCLGKRNWRSKGLILARDLVTKKEHVIWKKEEYFCFEVYKKTKRSTKASQQASQ